MNPEIAMKLYPVAIIQDRYRGIYSGGEWLAVANSDEPFQGSCRAAWLTKEGPGGSDTDAASFWQKPPAWIAADATPDLALAKLARTRKSDSRGS
jgi:hypothetical protein